MVVYLLIGESYLGGGVECEVVIGILLVEIFLELVVVELFLFVPVAYPGGGVVSIGNIVVMHAVILLFLELQVHRSAYKKRIIIY